MTATFKVKNVNPVGCSAYNAQALGTGGRGPNGVITDFPLLDVTIQPQQEYSYSQQAHFDVPGAYTFSIYGYQTYFLNPGNLAAHLPVSLGCNPNPLNLTAT